MDKMDWVRGMAIEYFRRKMEGKHQRDQQKTPIGTRRQFSGCGDKKDRRIRALIASHGPAISGQGGHNHTYSLACMIRIGMDCPREETFGYLAEWNESLADKWTVGELWHKIYDAEESGGEPGYLLNAPYTPPMSPELQRVHGACFSVKDGNRIEHFEKGWAPVRVEVVLPPPAEPFDLSDLAALAALPREECECKDDEEDVPIAEGCQHKKAVLISNKKTNVGGLCYFDCRRLSCESCGHKWIEIRCSWISFHFQALRDSSPDGSPPQVFLFCCPRNDLRIHGRYIKDHDGEYYAIDVYATGWRTGDAILMVSTTPPKGVAYRTVDLDYAEQALLRSARGIDRSVRRPWFWHSRAWGNPWKVKDDPQGFEVIAPISSRVACHLEVLGEYGINPNRSRRRAGGWQYNAYFFGLGQIDPKRLADDLNEGHRIPEWTEEEMQSWEGGKAEEVDFVGASSP